MIESLNPVQAVAFNRDVREDLEKGERNKKKVQKINDIKKKIN